MADKPTFDPEADTRPEILRRKCPRCVDAKGEPIGEVTIEEWRNGHLHRLDRAICPRCLGLRFIVAGRRGARGSGG